MARSRLIGGEVFAGVVVFLLCVLHCLLGIRKGTRLFFTVGIDVSLKCKTVCPVARGCGEPVEVADGIWAVVREKLLAVVG